jgi:chromosome segregation ATPase
MEPNMTTEMIPVPDTVKSESPAPVAVETDKSAAQDVTTPETAKAADGIEQLKPEEKELSESEKKRKERNRERWRMFNEQRQQALAEAARLRAENERLRSNRIDYSAIEDPDERLATMSAQKVRESFAGDYEQQARTQQARAESAVVEAWSAIKEDARERMPDFDSVVTDTTPIHQRAAPFIVESEKAAEIAYYLGKNVEVARDLYNEFERNPARALIKLGQIEAKVSTPAPKPHSSAPKPAPILGGSGAPPGFDASKSSVSDMQQQLKKWGVIR